MSVAELPTPSVKAPPPHPSAPAQKPDPYADAPSDVLFEVVNGVRVEKPVSFFEQFVAGILHERLASFCREHGLGFSVPEGTFTIPGADNDRRPDVAFVSFDTWPASRGIPKTNAFPTAPDLAVEVISPHDRMTEVLEKMREYFRGGVKQVWLVLPSVEQVHIYSSPTSVRILSRADELAGDPIVPGFRLRLTDLFPEPTPDPTPQDAS